MPRGQRYRVKVTTSLTDVQDDESFQFWLFPQQAVNTVAELCQQLCHQLPGLESSQSIFLDGFALLPHTPVEVIGETDVLQVVTHGTQVAGGAVQRYYTSSAILSQPVPQQRTEPPQHANGRQEAMDGTRGGTFPAAASNRTHPVAEENDNTLQQQVKKIARPKEAKTKEPKTLRERKVGKVKLKANKKIGKVKKVKNQVEEKEEVMKKKKKKKKKRETIDEDDGVVKGVKPSGESAPVADEDLGAVESGVVVSEGGAAGLRQAKKVVKGGAAGGTREGEEGTVEEEHRGGAGDGDGQVEEGVRKRSRSAARKAMKRKMRRLGLLPMQGKMALRNNRLSDTPQAHDTPEQPQLQKRTRRSRTTQVGAAHVYFPDTDDSSRSTSPTPGREVPEGAARPSTSVPMIVDQSNQLNRSNQVASRVNGGAQAVASETRAVASETQAVASKTQAVASKAQAVASKAQAVTSETQAVASEAQAVELPEDASSLACLKRKMMVGDIVAYKILEIGVDWTPQVSEYRYGVVSSVEEGGGDNEVILTAYPPGVMHPGQQNKLQRQEQPDAEFFYMGQDGNDEEDEEEGPESQYDVDGTLHISQGALIDVRLLKAGPHATAPHTANKPSTNHNQVGRPTAGGTALQHPSVSGQGADPEPPLPTPSYSKLGPPVLSGPRLGPPTAPSQGLGPVVPSIGAWAELSEQLKRRRQELMAGQQAQGAPVVAGGAPSAVDPKGVSGINTPGAVRPRGGVRSTAIGPLLKALQQAECATPSST